MTYPLSIIKEKINNKDVSMVGVCHIPKFFEENKISFENFVSRHDAMVLEESPENFWEDSFFGRIADIAHTQKKRVYQVDPRKCLPPRTDGISAGVGASLMLYAAIKKPRVKISRREFLKKIGILGIGASLFFGSLPGIVLRSKIDEESIFSYGADDFLTYGSTDYRDIKIAEGIKKICHEVSDIEKIVAFHGDAHSKHIEAYLKNPVLRAKKLAYLPYEVISNTKVREYVPTEGGWTLKRKF